MAAWYTSPLASEHMASFSFLSFLPFLPCFPFPSSLFKIYLRECESERTCGVGVAEGKGERNPSRLHAEQEWICGSAL